MSKPLSLADLSPSEQVRLHDLEDRTIKLRADWIAYYIHVHKLDIAGATNMADIRAPLGRAPENWSPYEQDDSQYDYLHEDRGR